jgi:hypothetical protein
MRRRQPRGNRPTLVIDPGKPWIPAQVHGELVAVPSSLLASSAQPQVWAAQRQKLHQGGNVSHQKSVQLHESDAVSKTALSPATAEAPAGSKPEASAASDTIGTFSPVQKTGDGKIPASLPDSRHSHMNIFDKNNRVTWLAVCIVIASIVGWILLHTGVIR